uniref:Uncharacterized protein n=1 Tax=viral metagenome TaxID=1070528 RepID=A0A6M3M1G7_9ZZZZ
MNKIKIGDIVSVSFHNSKFTLLNYAEVLHIPTATGDSWQFKESTTDDIYYISEGCTICMQPYKGGAKK